MLLPGLGGQSTATRVRDISWRCGGYVATAQSVSRRQEKMPGTDLNLNSPIVATSMGFARFPCCACFSTTSKRRSSAEASLVWTSFFVISGYLISRNILTDAERGHFSLTRFYERRVRRLFPAAFVTIVGTVVIGALWYSPNTSRASPKTSSRHSARSPTFISGAAVTTILLRRSIRARFCISGRWR